MQNKSYDLGIEGLCHLDTIGSIFHIHDIGCLTHTQITTVKSENGNNSMGSKPSKR